MKIVLFSQEKGLMTDSTQSFTITTSTPVELIALWKDVRDHR